MENFRRRFCSIFILWITSTLAISAQDFTNAIGYISSPKYVGISYSLTNKNSQVSNNLSLNLDLMNVLKGESDHPGLRLCYNQTRPFENWDTKSGTIISFYAGPGASVGYVMDYDEDFGWFIALSGTCGFDFKFIKPINIRIGIMGEFGIQCVNQGENNTKIKLYKNGIIRSVIPEISISYRF